jgi:hypothetical protein
MLKDHKYSAIEIRHDLNVSVKFNINAGVKYVHLYFDCRVK